MLLFNLLSVAIFVQISNAIPLPAIITRVHTAEAVTVTNTYTTATTTVYLPPVQVLVSDGATYTSTLTESPAGVPTTFTTIYNNNVNVAPKPTTQAPASAPAPQPTTTTQAPAPAPATTESPAPQPTTTTQAPAPAPVTTESPAPQPTTTTQAPAPAPATTESPAPQPTTTTTQAPAPATTESPSPQPTTTTTTESPKPQQTTTTQAPAPQPTTTTQTQQTTTQPPSQTTSSTSGTGTIAPPNAIVYSPYQDNGDCKSTDTINSDLHYIKSLGINNVRIYGTDCGNWDTILPTCVQLGIKVNQGFWISSDGVDSIDDDVTAFIAYGNSNGWNVFNYITIGNEAISAGYVNADQLVAKIQSVSSQVKGAGYNGPITTSEPPQSYIDNTQLCSSGISFVGVNAHSYFDASSTADQSGPFIKNQQQIVADVCQGLTVTITETGYPSQGNVNGGQVPSLANQAVAIESILQFMAGDVTILTTYNDFWKAPGPYNVEQYFGAAYLFQ